MVADNKKTKKVDVLVVDDDEDIRDLFVRIFGKGSYEVRTAESGEEALKIAQNEHFDVIFTDMRMPGMDGLDTFRALKNVQPEARTVILTGYSDEDRINTALEEGVEACLQKPVDISVLRKYIDVSKVNDILSEISEQETEKSSFDKRV